MNTTQPNESVKDFLYDAKKLLLDDLPERTPMAIYGYTKLHVYTYPNWDIVRNFDQFVSYIENNPMPALISFDHDLADVHYEKFLSPNTTAERRQAWEEYHELANRERTGYDCLQWLATYCHDHNVAFPQMLIHTMNTVGYDNMVFYYRSALRNKFIRLN